MVNVFRRVLTFRIPPEECVGNFGSVRSVFRPGLGVESGLSLALTLSGIVDPEFVNCRNIAMSLVDRF
jgi:hypothetical protein